MKRNITKTKGFGLLEVLLSGVIIITMLGALVILGRTVLSNLTYSAQRTQATFLAQQGIEIVREIRDTNYIDSRSSTQWNSLVSLDGTIGNLTVPEFDGSSGISPDYVVWYDNPRPTLAPIAVDPNAGRIATYDGSAFIRKIRFKKVSNLNISGPEGTVSIDENNAFIATCSVEMPNGKFISIDEMITNSHPNF